MTTSTINYVSCTEERGKNLTAEAKVKFDAALNGAVAKAAGVGGSVEIAEKITKEENTPVVLQIVKDCLDLTKNDPGAPTAEKEQATAFQQRIQRMIVDQTPPALIVSPQSGVKGTSVTVQGSNFYPNEPIKIYLRATLVQQATANEQGAFSATFIVPDTAQPGIPTTITAAGAASARSAEQIFTVK